MVYAGIDVGVLWTKAVVMKDGVLAGWSLLPTGDDNTKAARAALTDALRTSGSSENEVENIAVTGAGKTDIQFANKTANEVLCAARGICFLHPSARCIIDLGGESTRVAKMDDSGNVVDYAINDKCAAGTGIFLDAMSKVLGVPVEEMGVMSMKSTNEVNITSMCIVFAESEVISQVHRQTPKQDILKGIHKSISTRVFGMVNRMNFDGNNYAIGGLSRNIGIIASLEEMMKKKLAVPDNPQIVSALGAAIIASQEGGEA